jgi:hypothetical protein
MPASTVPLPLCRNSPPPHTDPLRDLVQIINEARMTRGLPPLSQLDWIRRTAPKESDYP